MYGKFHVGVADGVASAVERLQRHPYLVGIDLGKGRNVGSLPAKAEQGLHLLVNAVDDLLIVHGYFVNILAANLPIVSKPAGLG